MKDSSDTNIDVINIVHYPNVPDPQYLSKFSYCRPVSIDNPHKTSFADNI